MTQYSINPVNKSYQLQGTWCQWCASTWQLCHCWCWRNWTSVHLLGFKVLQVALTSHQHLLH